MITKEQANELVRLSKPLMKWIKDNYHPHCQVTVCNDGVELSEGLFRSERIDNTDDPVDSGDLLL